MSVNVRTKDNSRREKLESVRVHNDGELLGVKVKNDKLEPAYVRVVDSGKDPIHVAISNKPIEVSALNTPLNVKLVSQKRQQWEYKTFAISTSAEFPSDSKLSSDFGAEGWELVEITMNNYQSNSKYILIFKRLK